MHRNVRLSIVVLFVTIVICLVMGEVIVALLMPQQTISVVRENAPRIFRESAFLPYELLPDASSLHSTAEFTVSLDINSLGYRGPEFDREKGDRTRILVLGDSFTFGHGVAAEETYSSALERALNGAGLDQGAEVINAGYASCNYPDTYYLYLKRVGLELEPDIVIVGFFVGNDVDRQGLALHEWVDVDSAGLPLEIRGSAAHVEDGFWVSNNRALRHRLPIVRNSHLAQAIVVAATRLRAGAPTPAYNQVMYRRHYTERTSDAVARVKRLFGAMKALTDGADAQLAVLVIPAYEQVFPQAVFGEGNVPDGLDLLKPQREFDQFFADAKIPHLDLLPALREFSPGEGLYFGADQHWTPRGHEVAGELLASWLMETGMVRSATIAP
jgi:hypothetical protein